MAVCLAITNHLRDRFSQDRVYLVGQSWGTTVGVLAVQHDLYTAFIGTGQMVSIRETDTIFYDDSLAWAQANDDTSLLDHLTAIGPPPYEAMLDYETTLSNEHEVYRYDHSANSEGAGGFSENIFVSEYSLIDKVHLLGAFIDTFSVLYPRLQEATSVRPQPTSTSRCSSFKAPTGRRSLRPLRRLVPDDQRPDQGRHLERSTGHGGRWRSA